jgi:tripartite-type tricarboxylate transporter receptor subunit TctC
MKKGLKKILVILIGIIGLCFFPLQTSDLANAKDPEYPTKPITCYIAFGAGGTTDLTSRAFVGAAAKYIGQPFIPVNRPGAGGTLMGMAVLNSKPDGYTVGTITASSAFMAPFGDDSPYKDLRGFSMLVNFGFFSYPLLVRADAPWKTWQEFIEWARKNPRAAKVSLTGAKSTASQALVLWQVEQREKVEFAYIVFKGSAEVFSALLGGHITMYTSAADAACMDYIKEGKLRILSYLSKEKVPGYEHIPSLHDLYGYSLPNLLGLCGPKGIPEYVLKKMDDAFAKAVKDPDFVNFMNRAVTPVVYMDRTQMEKYVDETFRKAGEIVKILKTEEAKEKK